MTDVKELLSQLFSDLDVELTDEGELVVSPKNTVADEFKEFVNNIPDVIYLDVLEEFSKKISLKDAAEITENGSDDEVQEVFTAFKLTTAKVAKEMIDKLEKFI